MARSKITLDAAASQDIPFITFLFLSKKHFQKEMFLLSNPLVTGGRFRNTLSITIEDKPFIIYDSHHEK